MGNDEFEQLYLKHYDDLLRFALRRVDQPADAADVVAETWTIAWRRRESLPPPQERRLWLFGVARNVLRNQQRGHLRQAHLSNRIRDALDRAGPDFGTAEAPVLRALRTLPRADQDLLAMVAWEQLQPAEVALALNCSAVTARVRLHRARRRLRVAIEQLAPAPPPSASTLSSLAHLQENS